MKYLTLIVAIGAICLCVSCWYMALTSPPWVLPSPLPKFGYVAFNTAATIVLCLYAAGYWL